MSIALKLALVAALALALVAGVWKIRHGGIVDGRAEVQQKWDAEKLALSEKARLDEKAKTVANEGVDRAYQLEKQKRLALERVAADSLRDLTAALARADTAATVRTDDPRNRIIAECASALTQMDAAAGRLVDKVAGLRAYADRVCVTPP